MGDRVSSGAGVLRALFDEIPSDGTIAPAPLVRALKDAFGLERAGLFAPVLDDGIRRLELTALGEFDDLDLPSWRSAFVAGDQNGQFFDPSHVDEPQRNQVVSLLERFGAKGKQQEMLRRRGLDLEVDDITRVLLCDGAVLLAWIGGTHREPLPPETIRAFQSVVPALRGRFLLDRRLREAEIATRGLATALDRIAAPAFIVRAGGGVEHANSAGVQALSGDRKAVEDGLAGALAEFARGAATESEITALPGNGKPYWLVVLRAQMLDLRVTKAASTWGLTARQRDVLHGIVGGDANKAIAQRLSCTEATVEAHATAIYRKARVDGRSALIAKLMSI